MVRWREENLWCGKSAPLHVLTLSAIQEIFSFCSWYPDIENMPFFLYRALTRLLSADNSETNSAGCTLILSESTKALKFTHAHPQRSKCGGEILSFTEMFQLQKSTLWQSHNRNTGLLVLVCRIHIQAENYSANACTYTHTHICVIQA